MSDKAGNREVVTFVKQKIDNAKWFIDAIEQRKRTLLLTMEAIVGFQKKFFLTGDEADIRPMILKDIAEITGLDISTVSRVANSKYVSTPYGNFLLKFFFSEAMQTDSGEEVSTREVKQILESAMELGFQEVHTAILVPCTYDNLPASRQLAGAFCSVARRGIGRDAVDCKFKERVKSLMV